MWYRSIAALGILILGSGCAGVRAPPSASNPAPALPPAVVAADLPCVQTSHACIPLNPDVTEDTIKQTICAPGYTKTVRPSSTYTNGVKAKLLREIGLDNSSMPNYELRASEALGASYVIVRVGGLPIEP